MASPMNPSRSPTDAIRPSVSLPTRSRKGSRMASRRAPWRSGTAVARCNSRLNPSGSPSWSTTIWRCAPRAMRSSKKVTSPLSHAVRAVVSNVRRWTRGVASSCCSTSVSAGTSSCSRQLPESSTSSVSAVGRLQRSSPRPGVASIMPFTGRPFVDHEAALREFLALMGRSSADDHEGAIAIRHHR